MSGIGLIATILIGLRQLKLVKEDMLTKNKRASVEKSIEYLNWFATEILPKQYLFNKAIEESSIVQYKGEINESFVFDANCNLSSRDVIDNINFCINQGSINLLNQLEYLSAAFLSGLADEELAFNPLAEAFTGMMNRYYCLVCSHRKDKSTNMYSNSVKLYNVWNSRLKKMELEETRRKLDDDISKISDRRIKSIGS